MTATQHNRDDRDDRDRICPGCDTATPGEWDDVLRLFHCPTCSTTWRRRPGRMVPTTRAPRLPGLAGELTLESEWPDDERARGPRRPRS
jgi:hypothetical protein